MRPYNRSRLSPRELAALTFGEIYRYTQISPDDGQAPAIPTMRNGAPRLIKVTEKRYGKRVKHRWIKV